MRQRDTALVLIPPFPPILPRQLTLSPKTWIGHGAKPRGIFCGVVRIRVRLLRRRHVQTDIRKSSRCRLPLQLRADQPADFLPHGRRSGHRAAQGRVLPVHDSGRRLLALDQSARLELHHAEPLACRERRCAGGHFRWRSPAVDAVHDAPRSRSWCRAIRRTGSWIS